MKRSQVTSVADVAWLSKAKTNGQFNCFKI
jgi:hypothetical protein